MTPLTDFLLARIAEDEAAADLVLRPYGEHAARNDAEWWRRERDWFDMGLSSDETPLVTRMTPQRVLAECEAKRRIVEMHTGRAHGCDDHLGKPRSNPAPHLYACLDVRGVMRYQELLGCDTLRLLALPYADHEDYREEWRA